MSKVDSHAKRTPKHPQRSKETGKGAKAEAKDAPKPQAGSWKEGFVEADKNHDGKLNKREAKRSKLDLKAFDPNGNGNVTKAEFRVGHRQANSFSGLDRDRDGALDQQEMGKLKRFTKASYDTDGDGRVTSSEFVTSRRAENVARTEARRDAAFDAMNAKEKRALKRYDTDKNGAISREEFHAGRTADHLGRVEAKIAQNFAEAGGRNGALKGDDAKAYKPYDADADGAVTKAEFRAGQLADRQAHWDSVLTSGKSDRLRARRLDLDALGLGINRLDGQPGKPGAPSPTDPAAPPATKGDSDVVISSFNILGSSHTAAGGKHPEMASGVARMKGALQLLKQHQVDIVGMQEMQGDQLKAFKQMAGDKYGIYPGDKLGRKGIANSIAWDKSKWDLVKADAIQIPYFGGNERPMPVLLLRNKKTGQQAYVANFHNPADTRDHHNQERFRDEATRRQVALANRLRKTGLPVFITGDMNERAEYHQHMTKGSPGMHASDSKNGRVSKNPGIDWVFGSPDVTFTRHVRDRGALVQRTTDHPMIIARARIKAGR
jgi:Ca2+-binding EF-hand superfamily protein/exonuclease III